MSALADLGVAFQPPWDPPDLQTPSRVSTLAPEQAWTRRLWGFVASEVMDQGTPIPWGAKAGDKDLSSGRGLLVMPSHFLSVLNLRFIAMLQDYSRASSSAVSGITVVPFMKPGCQSILSLAL